ncbi:MAG: T9SS type A sorting domain-containing protein [Proteobacteria bacterium]|nr:T9SS type A sorting domain-containing protein [Pseudomonadota bacterium]
MGNQAGTTYDPDTFLYETKYFWRVDQVTSSGTNQGVLWSFGTEEKPISPEAVSNPSPANGELEVRTAILITWEPGKRTRTSNVYFGTSNPPSLAANVTENRYNPGQLDLNTKYYWRIDGVNEWGSTEGTVWEFTTQAVPTLPEGWASLDIGKVGISGDDDFENNSFIVSASGNGIEGNSDQFRFVYHELKGNGDIIARVVSIDNTNSTAMAGVMIREKLDSTSSNSISALTPTNGIKAKWRLFDGGKINVKAGSTVNAPYWVKLVRAGNYIVSYESADGKTWKSLKTEQITMQNDVYMGLVVTSGDNDSLCTAVFDNLIINGDSVKVGVEDNGSILPTEFAIGNYPNPFNPTTTIRYDLPEAGKVKIQIYDIMGSLITELVNSKQTAGSHSVEWSGKNGRGIQTASGIYLYRVQFNEKTKTSKMLLMK